jgi:hypothetical protein
MNTQYNNLMNSVMAGLEKRQQQHQAEQQQLQEIEEDRGMVPQNSNLVRNPQDIRRSTGHGSPGFQPIHLQYAGFQEAQEARAPVYDSELNL